MRVKNWTLIRTGTPKRKDDKHDAHKTTRRLAVAGLFLLTLYSVPTYAEVWNYPSPEPGRDVADISFYQAADDQTLMPHHDGRPRNVILLVGDGMSFNHVSMATAQSASADVFTWSVCR